MPFAASSIDTDGPRGLSVESMDDPVNLPGWQRWFAAFDEDGSGIVGHVDLKGDHLRTALHRCQLGIGIERPFRSQGLGVRLMQTAIVFVRSTGTVDWIDLNVFAHNTTARALYKRLGFVETGMQHDRFRMDGVVIDDVSMSLRVQPAPARQEQHAAQQQQ